jgi:pyruvate kinase
MTAKGVKKYVIKNKLTHDNLNVIKKKDRMRHKMNTIRSTKHVIGTYQIQKVTLSCFDDKRYLLDDGITSYAYGNMKIEGGTKEVTIVEECDSNKWVHTSKEYSTCEPVKYEDKPVVAVVIEEETVRLNNPMKLRLR